MDEQPIEITEANFHEHFFDVRRHGPKKGQVLAKFTAVAEFVSGQGKRDIINLLQTDKVHQAVQVMRRIHGVREPDCYRICREIAEDLLVMSPRRVENKPYEFVVEYLFYTKKEYVPRSKHWETIHVMEYDEANKQFVSRIEL